MPPETQCPFCGKFVPDWHFEWHPRQDQGDIVTGRKAMECPLCLAAVAFDGFSVTKAEPERAVAKRDAGQAARWARNQNNSLREYLQTREGEPYSKFWSDAEVASADTRAAADL